MEKIVTSFKTSAEVKNEIMKEAKLLEVPVAQLLESKTIALINNNWQIIGNEEELLKLENKLKRIRSILTDLPDGFEFLADYDKKIFNLMDELINEVFDEN